MTAIDVFCERCGARQPEPPRDSKAGGRFARRFNSAVGRSADGVPARSTEMFLRLCLECRGYSCPACWNDAEGRCQTCAPLPVVEAVVAIEPAPELVVSESVVEPGVDEPEPVAAAAPMHIAPRPVPQRIPEPEPGASPEPVTPVDPPAIEPPPTPAVVTQPPPPPVVIPVPVALEAIPTSATPPAAPPGPQPVSLPASVVMPVAPQPLVAHVAPPAVPPAAITPFPLATAPVFDPVTVAPIIPPRPRPDISFAPSGMPSSPAWAPAPAPTAAYGMLPQRPGSPAAGATSAEAGVRPCRKCELPLSAKARFCRRCGSAQES